MVSILAGFTVLRAHWSGEAGRPGELFGQLVDGQAHVVAVTRKL